MDLTFNSEKKCSLSADSSIIPFTADSDVLWNMIGSLICISPPSSFTTRMSFKNPLFISCIASSMDDDWKLLST